MSAPRTQKAIAFAVLAACRARDAIAKPEMRLQFMNGRARVPAAQRAADSKRRQEAYRRVRE